MATMANRESEGNPAEVETMSIDTARDVLGDLVARADYAGTPTIITRYGKDAAVVVGIKDFRRLSEQQPGVGVQQPVDDGADTLGIHGANNG